MTQAPAKYQGIGVEEGIAKLTAPHNGGDLTFIHPPHGPSTYAEVGLAIEQDNLKRPTMAETVSLVHAAFNSDDRYSTDIKDFMKAGLWAFTGVLYVPNEGAFIQDDPEIKDGMPFMNKLDLEEKLRAGDTSVRFVPYGYKVGEMSPSQLGRNPYVVGLAGEEGAENLARIADNYSNKPYLWMFKREDGDVARVSTRTFGGGIVHGLGVSSIYGDTRDYFAFGVEKTGAASSGEK